MQPNRYLGSRMFALAFLAAIPAFLAAGCAPTIQGIILAEPDGAPVPGAQVLVEGEALAVPPEAVESARGGKFAIKDLPPGTYDLYVVKSGFVSREVPGVVLPEKGSVKVPVGILRKATVQGMVRDLDGAPVPDAEIFSDLGSQIARSDPDGKYLLEYLDPGPNTLFGGAGTLVSGPVEVDLDPGPNEVDILLRPADSSLEAYLPGVFKKDDGALTRPLLGDGSQ